MQPASIIAQSEELQQRFAFSLYAAYISKRSTNGVQIVAGRNNLEWNDRVSVAIVWDDKDVSIIEVNENAGGPGHRYDHSRSALSDAVFGRSGSDQFRWRRVYDHVNQGSARQRGGNYPSDNSQFDHAGQRAIQGGAFYVK